MDLAKLEKMKVVDLRNELQTRGLDTKGVKALLIERLRAHVEGGPIPSGGDGVSEGTPVTPSRRQRRTRSMSRSPSPVVAAPIAAEPDLETLAEEEQLADILPESHDELNSPVTQENIPMEQVDSNVPAMIGPNSAYDKDIPIEEKVESSGDEYRGSLEIVEQKAEVVNEKEEKEENPVDDTEDEAVHSANGNSLQMEVDEEPSTDKGENQEKDADASIEQNQDKKDDLEKSIGHHSTGERRKRSHSHTRSSSGSRSPKRRGGDKRDSKAGAEDRTVPEEEPSYPENQVCLSWFDSDLHLRIDVTDFTSAKPLSPEIYSLMWAGARANYGVCNGKVCFEVRLIEEIVPDNIHHFRDEPHVRGFRVGFSTSKTSLLLGEAEHSYGYCESGRKAHNNDFVDYGKPYKLDDVIGCYLDLESTPCNIKYTLNGDDMGLAFEFDKTILVEAGALFPHIVTKGYEYTVNFADNEQLLVNAERPTRKRRKQRKDSQKDEDNDGEKWKVLDEAMADEDEIEKKEDEIKQTGGDQFEVASNICDSVTTVDKEEEIMKNQDANVGEPENKNISEATDDAQELLSEADIDTNCENETIANGDSADNRKCEDIVADGSGQQTPTKEICHSDGAAQPANDEKSPSPNKPSKTDTKAISPNQVADEYEDIVPIPRENVALLMGYILVAKIPIDQLIAGPQRAASRKDCEVILLVGLPGAGKTYWTHKHIEDHPDKRFEVIGPDAMIGKMTIDGNSRKTVHKGRWDKVYEICLNSLGALEDIAMKRRRNFILDQTNAYASAQRRKMKGFSDFKRIAVVCIPNEDELKRRITEKEEKGNAFTVKESTINNLRANFTLPSLEFGWFDDIIYTELTGDDAKAEVKKYNEKGKKAIDADRTRDKRSRGGRDHYRRDERNRNRYGDDRRRDYGGQRHDSRWNDSRRGGGGYSSGGVAGGSRGYDNRSRGYGGSSSGQQNWIQNNRQRSYDDRGYGGSGGGGGARGYDNRNRAYGGGSGGQQNWLQNNRQRGYDERIYGSGSSRDYRDRDRGNDRNRVGNNDRNRGSSGGSSQSNYRSGGGSHQQRDFRPGHRDTKEDNRGGYERSDAQMLAKYGNNSASMGTGGSGAYEQYKQQSTGGVNSAKTSVSGKWSTYAQHQQQTQQQHQQAGVWQQQQPMQQYQQPSQQSTGQQYWGYNQMQGYGNQPGWQGADQQQWMSWWQQQQTGSGASGVANAGGTTNAPSANNDSGATNHYWSQYSYTTQQANVDSEKK